MKRAGQHRRGVLRVGQPRAASDGHRLAQFGRPPRPGNARLDEPVAGHRRRLAGLARRNRTDRQQHRQRFSAGLGLKFRDEPANQRLLKLLLTGKCTDRHERRARDFRVQRVLALDQVRGTGDQLIDEPLRIEVRTRTRRAITLIRRADHVGQGRPLGGLLVPSAFAATADRTHLPSLPDPPPPPHAPQPGVSATFDQLTRLPVLVSGVRSAPDHPSTHDAVFAPDDMTC